MPIEKPESQTRGKKILFSFDDKKYSFLVQGAVQCNGNTFDWWNRDIMEMRNFHKMTTELDVSKMAENELMFYPHLNGEKTIYADTELRGAFTGINLSTTQEDLFYAVIEGLCMGFRELAEKMKLPIREYGSVKVVGGGAKSPVWLQTMANVLNVSVEKNGRNDRTCFWNCFVSIL
ncbi:MAG: FGGY-family carbohydrate kinase [Blautia caecimuris]